MIGIALIYSTVRKIDFNEPCSEGEPIKINIDDASVWISEDNDIVSLYWIGYVDLNNKSVYDCTVINVSDAKPDKYECHELYLLFLPVGVMACMELLDSQPTALSYYEYNLQNLPNSIGFTLFEDKELKKPDFQIAAKITRLSPDSNWLAWLEHNRKQIEETYIRFRWESVVWIVKETSLSKDYFTIIIEGHKDVKIPIEKYPDIFTAKILEEEFEVRRLKLDERLYAVSKSGIELPFPDDWEREDQELQEKLSKIA